MTMFKCRWPAGLLRDRLPIRAWVGLLILGLYAGAFLPVGSRAEEPVPTVQELIDEVDKLLRSESSYGDVEMTIVTPNWERTLRMDMWTRGMDETFVRVTSPAKDAGMATLRVDTEMWNYFPKIDKVMKIPSSMMMGSWMGSDFTNDDIVKESSLLDDYDSRLLEE